MKRLYFVRHGLSEMNLSGHVSGSTETPLAAEGKAQAKLAGEHAKALHIDHIIASPLSRAYDTAKIIAKEVGYPTDKIELNSLLIERHFGSLEGTVWTPDLDLDGFADVESHDNLKNRVILALEYVQTLPAENVLIVSHGATGRMFRHVIEPNIPFRSTDPDVRHATRFENAKIVQLL
ncbi:MAG: histidine phosphatase family protein [Candidatus Saccharimonadales bacterium]